MRLHISCGEKHLPGCGNVYVIDYDLLRKLLEKEGIYKVTRYDKRDVLPPEGYNYSWGYMPLMEVYSGKLMSLNVTAVKN